DPDLPQNANTPPGPAVAPAWSTCPQPRACKISGCNIRENALTTVSRDEFASGHTRTPCSPTEKTNTPTPGQAIQCKFSCENARPHTLPQSSIHLLTSRPVEGGGVSPPINVSVSNPVSGATGMPQILLNRSRHRRVSCYAASASCSPVGWPTWIDERCKRSSENGQLLLGFPLRARLYPWPGGLSVSPGSAPTLNFPEPPCRTRPTVPTLFSSGFSHCRRFCGTFRPLS